MKILIAEDEATSRAQLKSFLEPYGEISFAEDGDSALSAFREAFSEEKRFDLVCLDIMMPKRDGHSVLKEIRSIEAEKKITRSKLTRVIMTSALEDSGSVLGAFRAGCEAYVVKPIDRSNLFYELKKLGLIEE